MGIKVGVNGAVKEVSAGKVGVGGAVREVSEGWCGVNGTICKFLGAAPPVLTTLIVYNNGYSDSEVQYGYDLRTVLADTHESFEVSLNDSFIVYQNADDNPDPDSFGCELISNNGREYTYKVVDYNPWVEVGINY